jgi:hypothetical protein
LLKSVQERNEGIGCDASVNSISYDTQRIALPHGCSAAIADKGSLFIFCTESGVEFLILQIEHPAKREAYLS